MGGAISTLVPPLNIKLDLSLANNKHGRATCNNKHILL